MSAIIKPTGIIGGMPKDQVKLIDGLKDLLADAIDAPDMSDEQYHIAMMLLETLSETMDGRIQTIGIIACMEDGFASVMAGKQAGALNMACDELKAKILAAVTGKA